MIENTDIVKIENLNFQKDTFTIRWNMTKLCNYYCDFCIQGNKEKHIKDSKNESKELRKQICNKIIDIIENKISTKFSKVKIFLIGGEVTILKEFIEILEILMNCKFAGTIHIYITTNLSAKVEIIKKIKNIAEKHNNGLRYINITASYYKHFTTEKEFINKIKILKCNPFRYANAFNKKNKKSNLETHIVYPLITDEDYKKYLNLKYKYFIFASTIKYLYIRNYKQKISNNLKKKLSKKQLFSKIKATSLKGKQYYFTTTSQIGFILQDTSQFNPKGFMCDTGIYNITINNLGIVSKCPSCTKLTQMGNILKDNIELCNQKDICSSTRCNCDYYHTIEKVIE